MVMTITYAVHKVVVRVHCNVIYIIIKIGLCTYGLGDIFGVSPRLLRDTGCTCSYRSARQPCSLISPPPCDRNSKISPLYICGQ